MRWVLIAVSLAAMGCTPKVDEPAEAVLPGAVTVHPPYAGQGTTVPFTVSTQNPAFDEGDPAISFGGGLVVTDLRIADARTAIATVRVEPGAALGPRDVEVQVGDWSEVAEDAVEIVAQSMSIRPDSARPGEVVEVDLLGRQTAWDELSWARFGLGTKVVAMEVVDADHAVAQVAIDPDAEPGPRDVSVDEVTLYDGFTVEADAITVTMLVDPVHQGETVDFVVYGEGTAWTQDTEIQLWDDGGNNPDLLVTELAVLDGTNMYGRLRASNAAALGPRDLVVITGDQRQRAPDAVEVFETVPPLDRVYLHVSWDVERDVDQHGTMTERSVAWAAFVVPLDPPCGSPPPPDGRGPIPYDNVVVTPESTAGSGAEDCPTPKTLDAGPQVWLRSDQGLVALERTLDEGGAILRYERVELEPDYPFGQRFDFVTDGSGRIPALSLPGVLHTVPGDVRLLDASGRLHDRQQDMPITWTPALTYPDAELLLELSGRLVHPSVPATLGVMPWDDGSFALPRTSLTEFDAGPAEVSLTAEIDGGAFTLPFADVLQPIPTSSVRMTQQVFLD